MPVEWFLTVYNIKEKENRDLRLWPVCWEEPRVGVSWGNGAQFLRYVRLRLHFGMKQKYGTTLRTESTQSSQDFSRVWEVPPNTASLNGRNLVTSLLSRRFPLFWIRHKGFFRMRSKTTEIQGFASCQISQLSDEPRGICCRVSAIPAAATRF